MSCALLLLKTHTYIHTYIHKLYLSSDFSVAYKQESITQLRHVCITMGVIFFGVCSYTHLLILTMHLLQP